MLAELTVPVLSTDHINRLVVENTIEEFPLHVGGGVCWERMAGSPPPWSVWPAWAEEVREKEIFEDDQMLYKITNISLKSLSILSILSYFFQLDFS